MFLLILILYFFALITSSFPHQWGHSEENAEAGILVKVSQFCFKVEKNICKVWQVLTWVELARKENYGFNKLEEKRASRFIKIDQQYTKWCIVLEYNQCVDKWKVTVFREKPYSWLWKQKETVSTILWQYMDVVLFQNGRLKICTYRGNMVYWKDHSF